MVEMYKNIVVFLLTGGKTILVPVFYENYFLATLRLLEKLHKVRKELAYCCREHVWRGNVFVLVKWFLEVVEVPRGLPSSVMFPGADARVLSQVNLKAHHVEYSRFYIPDITSLVDIQEDYLKWFLSKAEIVSADFLCYTWPDQEVFLEFSGTGVLISASMCVTGFLLPIPIVNEHPSTQTNLLPSSSRNTKHFLILF